MGSAVASAFWLLVKRHDGRTRRTAGDGPGNTQTGPAVDARGIPLATVTAPANRPDSPLLASTLDALPHGAETMAVHLDRGYDSGVTRQRLAARGLRGELASPGESVARDQRWMVERTHAWMNAHKKLFWCTERRARVIDF